MDLGGDCEDLANLIHMVYTRLKYGNPDFKDPNQHHKRHGSWNDSCLQALQRVCYLYVGFGSLGTVTSRFLNEKESKSKVVVIGSEEDKQVEIGGHMWYGISCEGVAVLTHLQVGSDHRKENRGHDKRE